MIQLFINICDVLRPILFFALLGYVPMKIGISEFAFKPPSSSEIRAARKHQAQHMLEMRFFNIVLAPFRILAIVYFTIWLFMDKNLWFIVGLFVLTLIPLYIN